MKLVAAVISIFLATQISRAQNAPPATTTPDPTLQQDREGGPKTETAARTALIKTPESLHAFSAKSIDGRLVNLAEYKGKVVMVVNVASKCGFTPQYKDLEALYRKYKDRGFVVLGFPSNDFGSQEPGSNQDIAKFCKMNYDVTFPLFEKLPVKGDAKQPVYKFLTEQSPSEFKGEVAWNFVKFLVGKNGAVAARFSSSTKPLDKKVVAKVEEQLK